MQFTSVVLTACCQGVGAVAAADVIEGSTRVIQSYATGGSVPDRREDWEVAANSLSSGANPAFHFVVRPVANHTKVIAQDVVPGAGAQNRMI